MMYRRSYGRPSYGRRSYGRSSYGRNSYSRRGRQSYGRRTTMTSRGRYTGSRIGQSRNYGARTARRFYYAGRRF